MYTWEEKYVENRLKHSQKTNIQNIFSLYIWVVLVQLKVRKYIDQDMVEGLLKALNIIIENVSLMDAQKAEMMY